MKLCSRIFAILMLSLVSFGTGVQIADACVATFGYTGTTVANSSAIATNVGANTAYVVAPGNNPAYNLEPEVSQIVANTGPVFINLKEIIFNPNPIAVSGCNTHYERGPASTTKSFYQLRGDYQSRLDTWFAANSDLFKWNGGNRLVYSLVVHDEVNNSCVENWALHLASDYVSHKLGSAEYDPIYVAAGYGLRNTTGGAVSNGLPVTSTGAIAKFPSPLDLIGISAYDIFDPGNNSNSYNLNAETWSTISGKLNQALRSNQKTAGVVKAYCQNGATEEAAWGIQCPPYWANWWKLGVQATNWYNYLKNDSRNLFMLGFHWQDAGFSGTESLFTIWSAHSQITANCSIPLLHKQHLP